VERGKPRRRGRATYDIPTLHEKASDTTWHPGLLYKLSELKFSASLIKLIASFLSNRKFKVSVEGELSLPRKIVAGVPQGSVLAPVLYINIYNM
jgi:hypothetical protein